MGRTKQAELTTQQNRHPKAAPRRAAFLSPTVLNRYRGSDRGETEKGYSMNPSLSPILSVAKEILQTAGRKGMHVSEIAQAAVAQNKNMGLSPEEFQKKVQSALAANLKLKSTKPSFSQVNWDKGPRKGKPKQGWYRVKFEKATPVRETVPVPQVGKDFLGKAGEYAVMSELLFWEYNASIMAVDDGIDIVASKHNKFFHIQVKTASKQESGKFYFCIKNSSFKKYNSNNVFYVFVMRNEINNEYIIIPSIHIEFFLKANSMPDNQNLSITISSNSKKTEYKMNSEHDVTPFFGRFGEIIK